MVPILIQILTGAIGGNVAGALMKKASLGTLGNSIAGVLGGGLGGQLLSFLGLVAGPSGTLDLNAILGSIASGGVGGGVVMVVIGLINNVLLKKQK